MGSPSPFPVVFLITLIALAKFSVCHGSLITLTFQDYWNLMLHDTTMPPAVRDHLIDEPSTAVPTGAGSHGDHSDPVLLRRGNYGDGAAGGTIPQLSAAVLGKPISVYVDDNANNKKPGGRRDGVVLRVNGKPVTVDLDRKPITVYVDDNANNKKAGGRRHGAVLGVNGKPVTVDLDRKPITVYVDDNANNKKPSGRPDGVVLDVNGKPVTLDLERKPITIYVDANNKMPGGRRDGVVSGVNGKPVTVDLYSKPLSVYVDDNANNKKPGVAISYSSRKVGVGAAHHDCDDDVIDNLNARNFFLEKDLQVGAKLVMVLGRGLSGDTFLHREVADGIPFSSQETMEILRRFGVHPGSPMANKLEETIRRCEEPGNAEEMLFCATSFESMVDFVLASMGTDDLETLTTSVAGSGRGDVTPAPEQVYTVRSWAVVSTPNTTATACHVLKYPYTMFQCHRIPRSRTYVLKMVGEDGTAVDAATICHADTSKWSPTFYVLRAFGLRPGEETICHLMPDGDVTWLPRRGGRAAAASL